MIALACGHWLDSSSWCKAVPAPSAPAKSPSASLNLRPSARVALWWRAAALLTGDQSHQSCRWWKISGSSASSFWAPFCPYSFPHLFYFIFFITIWQSYNDSRWTLYPETLAHGNCSTNAHYCLRSSSYNKSFILYLSSWLLFFVPWLTQMSV